MINLFLPVVMCSYIFFVSMIDLGAYNENSDTNNSIMSKLLMSDSVIKAPTSFVAGKTLHDGSDSDDTNTVTKMAVDDDDDDDDDDDELEASRSNARLKIQQLTAKFSAGV